MSKLLDALHKAPRERALTCPRTGLELLVVVPTRAQKKDAERYAFGQWGDRPLANALALDEYESLKLEHLLSVCVLHEGTPIGLEAITALDETTLHVYDRVRRELEYGFDPPVETWTEAMFDELVDGIKKKDPRIEALLTSLDGNSLLSFMRTTVSRLPSAETSKS